MTADQSFRLTLSQPRWSATAVTLEDAGTAGERLVGRVRVVLCALLLFIPLSSFVIARSSENLIGLWVTIVALVMSVLLLVGAGVMVGFGTRMAGGCSSGHGLSGCSRLQPGSLLGTAAFFGAAVAVSFLLDVVMR